jgi:8-oxo-dGTP diphosphatase
LRSGQEWLLLERAKLPFVGQFLPVGGKIEAGEDPHLAALREIQEETGLVLPQIQFMGLLIETSPGPYNWMGFIYQAEIPWQAPPACPEGRLVWMPQNQLFEMPCPEVDRYLYPYLFRNQKFVLRAQYNENIELLHLWEDLEEKQLK